MNPYGRWDRVYVEGNRAVVDRFNSPGYAIYGEIFKNLADKYHWEARVLLDCRASIDKSPICGVALTLESAKKIVETLCYETNTCERLPKIQQDDLYFMILSFVDWCMNSGDITTPASKKKVLNLFGDKGMVKLKEMILNGIILEARNGMLSLPEWYLSGQKNPNDE